MLCGFGFEGYSEQGTSRGWNGVSNMDIIGFEFAPSIREASRAWNKGTQNWLERYVYSRTGNSLMATYFVSAFWHGFYPGYYLFFMSRTWCLHADCDLILLVLTRMICMQFRFPRPSIVWPSSACDRTSSKPMARSVPRRRSTTSLARWRPFLACITLSCHSRYASLMSSPVASLWLWLVLMLCLPAGHVVGTLSVDAAEHVLCRPYHLRGAIHRVHSGANAQVDQEEDCLENVPGEKQLMKQDVESPVLCLTVVPLSSKAASLPRAAGFLPPRAELESR